MIELTQNDWGQSDIINKIKVSAKRGSDKIHAIIMTKYQKCPSSTILKHENVLVKLNGSHQKLFTNKRSKTPLLNEQDIKENQAIMQLCQNLYVGFK